MEWRFYRGAVIDESAIRQRYEALSPVLDERGRRRFAAAEATAAGLGGIRAVNRATGIARSTIGRGLRELRTGETPDAARVRRAGGGRKPVSATNGSRVRLWKIELQKLADELGIPITVCHLPPGTSKWNKIEHRLFSFITGNWRGKPLVSHQVIVQLIAATTIRAGLQVRCQLDRNTYPAGIKVSDGPSTSPATTSMASGTILSAQHPHWPNNLRTDPKRLGVARDHQFPVRRYDIRGDAACLGADPRAALGVRRRIQLEPQP